MFPAQPRKACSCAARRALSVQHAPFRQHIPGTRGLTSGARKSVLLRNHLATPYRKTGKFMKYEIYIQEPGKLIYKQRFCRCRVCVAELHRETTDYYTTSFAVFRKILVDPNGPSPPECELCFSDAKILETVSQVRPSQLPPTLSSQ